MLKKKKGMPFRIGLMSLIILLFILGCNFMVCAKSTTGILHVELQNLKTPKSDRKDVEILIYKVGTVSDEGIPRLNIGDVQEEYPKDNESLEKTAEKLSETVKGEPAARKRTDENGHVQFEEIELGVYLVIVPENNSYGKVMPFLVPIPYCPKVDGVIQEPQFIVTAEPKASPGGESPEENEIPEKPDTVPNPNPEKNGGKAGTDDETNIERMLLMAVGSLGCILIMINYRRKRL